MVVLEDIAKIIKLLVGCNWRRKKVLKEVLKKMQELNILIRPFGVEEEELYKNNKECIVYNYSPVAQSNRFRLDIRVISESLSRCLEIRSLMEDLFVGIGDTVKVPKCTKITFEGGASARETETNTVHLLFSISFIGHK